jgi:HEAT repeat protein
MRRAAGLLLPLLLSLPAWPAPPGAEADDQKLLEGVKAPTDGPGLLTYFRQRAVTEDVRKRADALVEKLSSGNFRQRERASAGLVALGPAARPALARALKNGDAEVRRRAQECIDALDRTSAPEVEAAAVRLLKVRRPEGACAVLLGYLPAVRDAGVEDEVMAALLALGVRGGKVDEELARAVTEKEPAKRAAAALVLGHSGTRAQRDKVHALLRSDAVPKVRLRAAQGLLAGQDKTAVPPLLPLLTDAPPAVAEEAHDLLGWVAGDKAPALALGEDAAARKKCREGWEAWWKANGDKLDLSKATTELPWLNPAQQARAVTLQFANALVKGDAKGFGRAIDVPFHFMGYTVMKTRAEVDKMLGAAVGRPGRPKVTFSPPRLGDLQGYLNGEGKKLSQALLADHPRGQIRLVYLTGKMEGTPREETAAIFVRLRGGRAKVVGIGEASARK